MTLNMEYGLAFSSSESEDIMVTITLCPNNLYDLLFLTSTVTRVIKGTEDQVMF